MRPTPLAIFAASALLLGAPPGCASSERAPRGHSPWRPVLIVKPVTQAVLQGEGGPVEVEVQNAGYVPVRAIEVQPESQVDDGAPFQSAEKGLQPVLDTDEIARATVIARPDQAGTGIVRRFFITFADATKPEAVRRRPFEVRLDVAPAAAPIEDARSRARVGSSAAGVYSAVLVGWGFERPDGVVFVPDEGETRVWRGVSIRAFAWADLFIGHVPVRFSDGTVRERGLASGHISERADEPGEAAVPEGEALDVLFDWASENGYVVDGLAEGTKRHLHLRQPGAQP